MEGVRASQKWSLLSIEKYGNSYQTSHGTLTARKNVKHHLQKLSSHIRVILANVKIAISMTNVSLSKDQHYNTNK